MIFFFDIDATMTDTGGRGVRAMQDAGRELFSPGFTVESVSFAGSLDTVLTHQLFELNQVAVSDAAIARFRSAYTRHLAKRLAEPGAGRALPGVHELLAKLRRHQPETLAVLTGNFTDAGAMKLRACNINPEWFSIGVFADDAPHSPERPALREHLVDIGLKRYRAARGRALVPHHAVVIGDTPHDVRCGKAHGTRTLGVATGRFSAQELADAGADRAVESLVETDAIHAWLTNP